MADNLTIVNSTQTENYFKNWNNSDVPTTAIFPTTLHAVTNNNVISSVGTDTDDLPKISFWYAIVGSLLSISIVLGNFFVILLFSFHRKLRTISNFYIVNLAVSDFLVGILSVPVYTMYATLGYWPLGRILCDLWTATDYTVCSVSLFAIIAISVDRHTAIVDPIRHLTQTTKRRALCIILMTWLISIVLYWLPNFSWPHIQGFYTVPEKVCVVEYLEVTWFVITQTVLGFWLPLIIQITLYLKIYRIAHSIANRKRLPKHQIGNVRKNKGKTAEKPQFDGKTVGENDVGDVGESVCDEDQNEDNFVSLNKTVSREELMVEKQGAIHMETYNGIDNLAVDVDVEMCDTNEKDNEQRSESNELVMKHHVPEETTCSENRLTGSLRVNEGATKSEILDQSQEVLDDRENTATLSENLPSGELSNDVNPTVTYDNDIRGAIDAIPFDLVDGAESIHSLCSQGDVTSIYPISSSHDTLDDKKATFVTQESKSMIDESASPSDIHINIVNTSTKGNPFQSEHAFENEKSLTVRHSSLKDDKQTIRNTVNTDKYTPDISYPVHEVAKFRRSKDVFSEIKNSTNRSMHARKGLITVSTLLAAFILCWMPYHTVAMVITVCSECFDSTTFGIVYWIYYTNSALNPLCYALANKNFRDAFRRLICECRLQS
ncbi:muscarinic acetylcholine receptor M2-like [Glandiceps talaboti]